MKSVVDGRFQAAIVEGGAGCSINGDGISGGVHATDFFVGALARGSGARGSDVVEAAAAVL